MSTSLMRAFERKPDGEEKVGIWRWKDNPFTGRREFNGLRVMMAVMNNWDLKDVNNAVYSRIRKRIARSAFDQRYWCDVWHQWTELDKGAVERET